MTASVTAPECLVEAYERRLAPARERFDGGAFAREVASGVMSPEGLEVFLMWFTALGQHMTRPVAGWHRRAGERCQALGHRELGQELVEHAEHADGQDRMLREDARNLVKRWNDRRGEMPIETGRLLAARPTAGVRRFAELQERVIDGPAPWGQIAIDHEMERLSTTWSGTFLRTCLHTLGPEIRDCLSFLDDQDQPEAGEERANADQLDRLLRERPEALEDVSRAGADALDACGVYLDDCLRLTRTEVLFRPDGPPMRWRLRPSGLRSLRGVGEGNDLPAGAAREVQ